MCVNGSTSVHTATIHNWTRRDPYRALNDRTIRDIIESWVQNTNETDGFFGGGGPLQWFQDGWGDQLSLDQIPALGGSKSEVQVFQVKGAQSWTCGTTLGGEQIFFAGGGGVGRLGTGNHWHRQRAHRDRCLIVSHGVLTARRVLLLILTLFADCVSPAALDNERNEMMIWDPAVWSHALRPGCVAVHLCERSIIGWAGQISRHHDRTGAK